MIKTKDIIIILLILLLIGTFKTCNDKDRNNILYEHNIEALNDSIHKLELKNDYISFTSQSFVSQLNDLGDINKSLHNRIKGLKKELKVKPKIYTEYNTKIVHDTVKIPIEKIIIDSSIIYTFSYDTVYSKNNSKHLSGYFKLENNNINNIIITKDSIKISAELIVSEKDKKLKASIISKYPGFEVFDINSVVLEPELLSKINKKERFIIGPSLGIGIDDDLNVKPFLGVSLVYKIIKL